MPIKFRLGTKWRITYEEACKRFEIKKIIGNVYAVHSHRTDKDKYIWIVVNRKNFEKSIDKRRKM